MSLESAIADMKKYSQAEFSQEIIFTTPDESMSVIVHGLVSKHSLSIDPETGQQINSRNSHISIHEQVLIDEGYSTRDSKDEISLKGHKVEWIDSSGNSYSYLIDQTMPSMTTGLIVCITGELNG